MNETSKFLFTETKFMPEIHLRQLGLAANIPRFTYKASGSFTKNAQEEFENLRKQETLGISMGMNQTKF